ncbi:putative cytochrome P450 [Daldinia vernicosa]|uniref:putative cytochrome P450 n=1 Tax=Daldinia vernicosa TaxID=114800 RepID=UPI002007526F|nr:putative cytochrome P450 [Daldinia vernicosa]KAI0845840.1 putative cytochrome P450 [Daldinia vernicosa]
MLFRASSDPLYTLFLAGTAIAFVLMLSSSLTALKTRSIPIVPKIWSTIRCRIKAWVFLFNGRKMMSDAYKESQGAPFHIDVPENRYWVVSSRDHIKEMDAAPQSVLSLLGAAKDLLQPKYTMKGFNWMEDKQGTEGATLIRTLRNDLTGHLPEFLPEIRLLISALIDQHFESIPLTNGTKTFTIFPLVCRAIAHSNAFIFFGKELSQNPEFIKAGISMVEDTLILSDIVRLLPETIADPVGKFLASWLNSGDIVYNTLEPMVAQRFEERDRAKLGYDIPEHKDCVQWIMDNSPKTKPWTVQRVVHELVALWYGSVHITSVTACLALFDLCNQEDYAQPLRDEIKNTGWESFDKSGGRLFPLMDSFIKESARLNPVECMSIRRKALKPFHFQDGTRVEAGQWICSPLAAMNLDPKYHARPDEFHGFRFVQPNILEASLSGIPPHNFKIPEGQNPSQFTDMSDLPMWGAGKMTCGGRFYASSVIKTLLGLFLTKWDMQLERPNAKQYFAWRSWTYPYANTKGIVRTIGK